MTRSFYFQQMSFLLPPFHLRPDAPNLAAIYHDAPPHGVFGSQVYLLVVKVVFPRPLALPTLRGPIALELLTWLAPFSRHRMDLGIVSSGLGIPTPVLLRFGAFLHKPLGYFLDLKALPDRGHAPDEIWFSSSGGAYLATRAAFALAA